MVRILHPDFGVSGSIMFSDHEMIIVGIGLEFVIQ